MPHLDSLGAFDGWELEEKLAHVRRILGKAGETGDSSPLPLQHEGPSGHEVASFFSVAWVLTKLAVSAITCGGILAAWWWIADRQDLIKPALTFLTVGHLAWLGQWGWEGYRQLATISQTAD